MKKLLLNILAVTAVTISCSREVVPVVPTSEPGHVTVGFGISGSTRTAADGLSTEWVAGDAVALWAVSSEGQQTLSAHPFRTYGLDAARGWFTSELAEAMAPGTYTYYASYPIPESVEGTVASFLLPSVQDGLGGEGTDIMVAVPAQGSELKALDKDCIDHSELSLAMNHLTHRLRFYFTEGEAVGGESIRKIEASFPSQVTGTLKVDVADPSSAAVLSGSSSVLTMKPDQPVQSSTEADRKYVYGSIAPVTFGEAESLDVKMFTETKVVRCTLPLQGRTFAAGHSTAVRIAPQSVSNLCRLSLNVVSNNLGEPVQQITFTAPDGTKWSDNGSSTWVYATGGDIDSGHAFEVEYEDETAFRTLSGKTVTVTYDSEHVTISEQITIPNLDGKYSASLSLNVPYLLFEDFANVPSFSSSDAYATSNAGSKSAYSFLNGWTGGRVGAEEGHCIRIACRRETSSDYPARVDSKPISGTLKKAADLSVEFDYGANNKYGGLAIITDGNVGQTCHIGYVTTESGLASGSSEGTFEDDNSFYIKEYTGEYTNTPNTDEYTIHEAPANSVVRISWRTEIEHQAGTTNTTAWLYLDNIKVKVKSK